MGQVYLMFAFKQMLYHLNIYPIDTYYLQLQDYRPIHMDNGFT